MRRPHKRQLSWDVDNTSCNRISSKAWFALGVFSFLDDVLVIQRRNLFSYLVGFEATSSHSVTRSSIR